MAETQTFTYVSLDNITLYDELSKRYFEGLIAEGDAKSLKTVALDGNTLKFYKVTEPVGSTSPAYSIELPETDVSDFVHLIKNATVGDVIIANADGSIADGGVKLTDLAKTVDVNQKINDVKSELDAAIGANAEAIGVLNGSETSEGSVKKAVKDAKDALQAQITANKEVLDKLDGADTVDGSVKKQVKDAKTALESKIGNIDDLATSAKDDLVSAVNENKATIDSVKAANEITVDTTTTSEGMAKSYTIKQGSKTITTIDIPKDMVVKSGTVQENPTGQPTGTYLVLTLANATEDTIYINVGKLVDIYTAQADATQIQIEIDSSTREISATIVAGSVTSAELANNAVVTTKIADGNVTKAKLAKTIQDTLDKADTAVQEADITELRSDVAANKASLAEGGATATAIKTNKEAIATIQDNLTTITDDLTTLTDRVEVLESVKYVAATDAQIKALFPTVTN